MLGRLVRLAGSMARPVGSGSSAAASPRGGKAGTKRQQAAANTRSLTSYFPAKKACLGDGLKAADSHRKFGQASAAARAGSEPVDKQAHGSLLQRAQAAPSTSVGRPSGATPASAAVKSLHPGLAARRELIFGHASPLRRPDAAAAAAARPVAGQAAGSGVAGGTPARAAAQEPQGLSWRAPDPLAAMQLLRGELRLNGEQLAAATADPEQPKMIRAGAGTGKTTTIVARIIYMTLGMGVDPARILAVTFTKKAAGELRERLEARGAAGVKVATFHAYCALLLGRFWQEAGFAQRPLILTSDAELKALLGEAMRWVSLCKARGSMAEWLGVRGLAEAPALQWAETKAAAQRLHPTLYAEAEEEAALTVADAKQKLSATAEKQRELAAQAAAAGEAREAATELGSSRRKEAKVQRVSEMELVLALFRRLARVLDVDTWERNYSPEALARKAIKRSLERKGGGGAPPEYGYDDPGAVPHKAQVKQVFDWLQRQKGRGLLPQHFAPTSHVLAYARYLALLREAGAVDFDGLLTATRDLLRADASVRRAAQRRHRYLLVDEYQDSNPLQVELVELLQGEERRVTVVGDDAQSIYGFRGAVPGVFAQFIASYSHEQLEQALEQNYRSRPGILAAGMGALADSIDLLPKQLQATKPAADGCVQLWEVGHQQGQAEEVAREIRRLHEEQGVPYEGMACLMRSVKRRTAELQAALMAAGVPYQLLQGRPYLESREALDLMAFLRLCLSPRDDTAFARVVNRPPRRIGDALQKQLAAHQADKRLRAEAAGGEADCSLAQCARELLASGQLSKANATALTKFLALLASLRTKCLEQTPAELVVSIVNDTGFVKHLRPQEAEARAAKKAEADAEGEGNALAGRLGSDDSDEEGEAEEDLAALASPQQRRAAAGGGPARPSLGEGLPTKLRKMVLLAEAFQEEWQPEPFGDEWDHTDSQGERRGPADLQRLAAGHVAEHVPALEAAGQLEPQLLEAALAVPKRGPAPLLAFLENVSLTSDEEAEVRKERRGVAIGTIHSAKGLEWDTVFTLSVNNGSLPIDWRPPEGLLPQGQEQPALGGLQPLRHVLPKWGDQARRPPLQHMTPAERAVMQHFEEERRLLHVAVTRAKERAVLVCKRWAGGLSKEGGAWCGGREERSYFLRHLQQKRLLEEWRFPEDQLERDIRAAAAARPRHF